MFVKCGMNKICKMCFFNGEGGVVLILHYLQLAANNLFSDMGGWTAMTELNLSTNQLRVLPDDIEKLINLEVYILISEREFSTVYM